ncbi:orotidine-5'-phosphate decarboxylase [Stratiformator vulcanicus]|uniref:Orotidine 5'-phosphate decarboxylase n=1 Tax=Stratiformator vulcanicus TaxID=2527980 RepID=A0A517R6S4_9PLAN|nr:orotidine-5'-phosphate decarboxylase [Stratiformator vulcanicus]QDT39531.1 Orotidine 5'-phosphate decarboxylase [Stratiformator vulcanicus]
MSHFAQRLHAAIKHKQTPALVGLDPRLSQLPPQIVKSARTRHSDANLAAAAAFEEFCIRLIDVVTPLVPAVKPQSAFFEELGPAGSQALANVISHARSQKLIVILDAKRGDIGSTAEAYARGLIGGADPPSPWMADALTVNPYLGTDTLQPFVDVATERGGGIYVLVRTSNPGASAFQDRSEDGQKLFETVGSEVERLARETSAEANYGCVGAVVGATYPAELAALREAMPHTPLLVPGYGSQGGTAADVASSFDTSGLGAVINSSRAINFAFRAEQYATEFGEERWEEAAEAATRAMISDLADLTPASALQT